jgi:predicted anti-sigma-YlaC factor YlaD
MFSCQRAARLTSDALDRSLSTREQFSHKSHLLICSNCRLHRRQFTALHRLFQHAPTAPHLPPEARARIAAALQNGL